MPVSPLLSGSLPSFTPGPHKNIGYAYLRTKALFPYTIPTPKHKETDAPVLEVDGVSYALFYPCQKPKANGWFGGGSEKVAWFPEPTSGMLSGYEKFIGKSGAGYILRLMKLVIGRLKVPVHLNAPLEERTEPWPLALFSHGLAGTRTTYTQYVSALASQGYAVLVVEHRDGSAPAVVIPKDERVMLYVKQEDLVWEGEKRSLEHFRTLQLDMRVREMYEAYHSFKKIVEGSDVGVTGVEEGWFDSWRVKLDTSKVDLTGHSFGSATVLHMLQNEAPEGIPSIPIRKAVALDPWLEPLSTPAPSTASPNKVYPPLLVINAPGFTQWTTHFKRCVDLVRNMKGSLVTVYGTNLDHADKVTRLDQSFSDFPLLMPTGPGVGIDHLATIHELTRGFLSGSLDEVESVKGQENDGGDYAKDENGKLAGKQGDVVVHLMAQ